MKNKLFKKGFTLIEIVVAILLFSILLLMAVTKISNYFYENSKKANAEKVLNTQRQIATAVIAYKVEYGTLPDNITELIK